ncbi:hypothetical protein CY34DRAFT_45343, partial [Suillus luteus UH-Slu-Lm8-n1]
STTPVRTFEDHNWAGPAFAVFPDRRRMVTSSVDNTLRIWDLETGEVLKKMEGHSRGVFALAVSRDGQIIASGNYGGELIAWHGETGESLAQPIKAHSNWINSVDFSPDGTVLATGSGDDTVKFWCTKTWQMQERVASFKGHTKSNRSLAWTPDGTRLLSAGEHDSTIREWNSSTWQQVGHPWEGHTSYITAIAIDPTGTLVASASEDKHVRLWRLSDRRIIGIFEHSSPPNIVTFSFDGRHILSGGGD